MANGWCYYLRLESILNMVQVPHFTIKGIERREDLTKVHPELEARSLDPQSGSLYTNYTLLPVH